MRISKWMALIGVFFSLSFVTVDAQAEQTIQIYTHLHSFVGKPTWLLIIRDMDSGEVTPYLYDFKRGDQFWIALADGRHYRITASNLTFTPYRWKIRNFCSLEGHLYNNESLYITLDGDLSPDDDTFNCHVSRYKDSNFTIASPNTGNE